MEHGVRKQHELGQQADHAGPESDRDHCSKHEGCCCLDEKATFFSSAAGATEVDGAEERILGSTWRKPSMCLEAEG